MESKAKLPLTHSHMPVVALSTTCWPSPSGPAQTASHTLSSVRPSACLANSCEFSLVSDCRCTISHMLHQELHRSSVKHDWLRPHFPKTPSLYENARQKATRRSRQHIWRHDYRHRGSHEERWGGPRVPCKVYAPRAKGGRIGPPGYVYSLFGIHDRGCRNSEQLFFWPAFHRERWTGPYLSYLSMV